MQNEMEKSPLRLINDLKYVISFILCQIYQKWPFILFRYIYSSLMKSNGYSVQSLHDQKRDASVYPFLFGMCLNKAYWTEKRKTDQIYLNRSICKIVFFSLIPLNWTIGLNDFVTHSGGGREICDIKTNYSSQCLSGSVWIELMLLACERPTTLRNENFNDCNQKSFGQ